MAKRAEKKVAVTNEITDTQEFGSVKAFLNDNALKIYPKLRTNVNGYPFITTLDPSGTKGENAENIYLSKGLSEKLDLEEGDSLSFLKDCVVTEFTYASGEVRMKVCAKGEGGYVDADDLF